MMHPEESLLSAGMMARLTRLRLTARKVASTSRRGQRRDRRLGGGSEVVDKRAYALGDDARRIDWSAYARTERLMVRVTADETPLRVMVVVDASASMAFGQPSKLRVAKEIAAGLCVVALGNQDRAGVAAASDSVQAVIPPAKGELSSLLRCLSALEPSGTTQLSLAAGTVDASAGGRCLVILISDTFSLGDDGEPGVISLARALKSRGHRSAIVEVLDPFEVEPPDLSGYEVECSETGELIGLGKSGGSEGYKAALADHRAAVDAGAHSLGARVLRTVTAEPFESTVLNAIRSGVLTRGSLQ